MQAALKGKAICDIFDSIKVQLGVCYGFETKFDSKLEYSFQMVSWQYHNADGIVVWFGTKYTDVQNPHTNT